MKLKHIEKQHGSTQAKRAYISGLEQFCDAEEHFRGFRAAQRLALRQQIQQLRDHLAAALRVQLHKLRVVEGAAL